MAAKYCQVAVASIIALSMHAGRTHGQEAGAAPAGSTDTTRLRESERTELEEIVVTARRQAERATDVPIAISAFSQEDMRRRNIQTATDLQNFVPSLNVLGLTSHNQESFTIRGIGSTGGITGGGPGGGPGVIAYLAEAPSTASGPGTFFDLDSLQVLKGPQGTLFGRNTTGGAVLLEPTRPGDDIDGYAEATFGDFNRRELRGAGNMPLIPGKLSVRIAGEAIDRDGYTTDAVTGHDYNNRESRAVRLGVLATAFDGLENYFLAQYVYRDEHGPGNVLVAVNPVTAPYLLPYLSAQQARDTDKNSLGFAAVDESRALTLIDNARWQLTDGFAIKNVMSYTHMRANGSFDGDGTPLPVADLLGGDPGGWSNDLETFTEELQFQGKAWNNWLSWQAGGYYERARNPEAQTYNTQFGAIVAHQDRRDHYSRSRAGYAQATLDLGSLSASLDDVNLTAGYRHTWDDIEEHISISIPALGGLCLTGPGPMFPNCVRSGISSSDGPSWTVSVDYHVNEQTTLYVRSSQGYKSGGFNGVDTASPFFAYRPEKARDVELGIKADLEWETVRLRTDFDVFRTDYTDVQRNVYALVNGVPSQVTSNAASATIQGVELSATLVPLPAMQWTLTYSYNDASYDRYVTPIGQDFTDHPFQFTPEHKASLDQRYRLPFDEALGEVTLAAAVSYQSEMSVADDPQPFDTIGSYTLINLRLDWAGIAGSNWDASLFATNVDDEVYRITSNATYNIAGLVTTIYGEPRMIGGSLRCRF